MDQDGMGADEPLTPAERQFLIDSGVPANSFDPDVKEAARARLHALAEETRRKASPELTVDQVAGLLDCDRTQVLAWVEDQELYAYDLGYGLRLPEWQFPDGQRLPGLRLVLSELPAEVHPYSVEGLLALVPHEELDDTSAVAWLASGRPTEPVVALAVSHSYGM